MSLLTRSQLMHNVSKYGLDSRIGKVMLSVKATDNRMGERISVKPGYSPVVVDNRLYRHGDSIKDIDWKIYSRTEQLFIKVRESYRQTRFTIVVDTSESMRTVYGSNDVSKFINALTVAYITGKVALKAKDRVYLCWANNTVKIDSEQHLLNFLLEIEKSKAFDMFLNGNFDFSGNVFFISDFFINIDKFSSIIRKLTGLTSNLYLFAIRDLFESSFDFEGRFRFLDPESDKYILANSYDIKDKYLNAYKDHFMELNKIAKSYATKFNSYFSGEDPFNFFVKAVT